MTLFSSITPQERVDFAKHLQVMLKSGITIDEALESLIGQVGSARFGKIIGELRDSVRNGEQLSTALEKKKHLFGAVFVSLIRAGEESGTLEENLRFLADWYERSTDLKRDISSATLYPKIVFGAAFVLGGCLAIFILPRLVPLFGQLNVELPLFTRILLAVSVFIATYWHFVLIGLVLTVALFVFVYRIYGVRKRFHWLFIRMPVTGDLIKNYQLALITQLFGTLIRSGLTLNDAVAIVKEAATNIYYQESLQRIESHVVEGTKLSNTLTSYPHLYPKMFQSVVFVGEKSGTLRDSFEYLSEYYTKEVNAKTKKLPTIVEPILLILIALVVGFIALSIIMPIYSLTGSIT